MRTMTERSLPDANPKYAQSPRKLDEEEVAKEYEAAKQAFYAVDRTDPEAEKAANERFLAISNISGALEGAKERYENAKLWLIRHHAFYGSFLCQFEQWWSVDVSLGATNGVNLVLNPTAIAGLTNEECRFLLMHEIQHIAHLHGFRTKGREHELWNKACDYSINDLLKREGRLQLHPESLWDERFEDMAPEQIFTILEQEVEEEPPTGDGPGDGESGKGDGDPCKACSGSGEDENGAECPACAGQGDEAPEDGSAPPPGKGEGNKKRSMKVDWTHGDVLNDKNMDNVEKAELEARVKRLAYEAAFYAKAMGQDSETIRRVIQSMAPKTSWQLSLASFVEAAIDKDDYTWARPRRRYIPQGIYLPDMGGTRPPKALAIAVDVSGSVNEKMLELFLDEMSGMIYQNPELSYYVYAVDTSIKSKKKLGVEDMPMQWDVRAGGGTDFRPAFADIAQNDHPISGLIYFTDMYCYDYPHEEPPYPVMWLNFGNMTYENGEVNSYYTPPWGEVVDMRLGYE